MPINNPTPKTSRSQLKFRLAEMYLDWFNNFGTVSRYAEHYELSELQALRVVRIGRKCHEKRVRELDPDESLLRDLYS